LKTIKKARSRSEQKNEKMKHRIGASILSAGFSHLADEIERVEKSGVDFIHFDVIDTSFANFISFGSLLIHSLRDLTNLPFDVHCYVANPLKCIKEIVEAGANSVTVHLEMADNLTQVIDYIKQNNVKAGIALLPETPPESLKYIIDKLDVATVVGVDLFSFGKWQFIPSQLGKIKEIRHLISQQGLQTDLQVDGGVTLNNAEEITRAGANVLVVGSALFKSSDMTQTVTSLREIMNKSI